MNLFISIALAIAVAVLSRLMADEAKAWLPWIVERLIFLAVRRLPEYRRERFAEEWRSNIAEYPGDIAKFVQAIGFVIAAGKMGPTLIRNGDIITDTIRGLDWYDFGKTKNMTIEESQAALPDFRLATASEFAALMREFGGPTMGYDNAVAFAALMGPTSYLRCDGSEQPQPHLAVLVGPIEDHTHRSEIIGISINTYASRQAFFDSQLVRFDPDRKCASCWVRPTRRRASNPSVISRLVNRVRRLARR